MRYSSVDEQAFEQVVSRFEQYLQNISMGKKTNHGLLIHDNNQTVALKHTMLMKDFHNKGTLWTSIKNIIETPLFVDYAYPFDSRRCFSVPLKYATA